METQKIQNSKSNPEKEKLELEVSGFLTSDYIKNYNNQNNMILAQKIEIQINRTEWKAQRETHTPNF